MKSLVVLHFNIKYPCLAKGPLQTVLFTGPKTGAVVQGEVPPTGRFSDNWVPITDPYWEILPKGTEVEIIQGDVPTLYMYVDEKNNYLNGAVFLVVVGDINGGFVVGKIKGETNIGEYFTGGLSYWKYLEPGSKVVLLQE